jgi:hypothetical protein
VNFWQKYGAQRATDRPRWGGAFLTFGCGHQDETRYDQKAYTPEEISAWAQRTQCKDCRGLHRPTSLPHPRPGTSKTMMCAGQDSRSTSHQRCEGQVRVDSRVHAANPYEPCACGCHKAR